MTTNWRFLFFIPLILLVILFAGRYITTSPFIILALVASIVVAFITFRNPEDGILILVFSMLLSPEIAIANVPGRAVTIRIDDLLIIVVFLAWLAHTTVDKDWKGFIKTPLDMPLLALSVIYILGTALGIIAGNINPIKGLFYTLKYIEYFILYWTTVNVIKSKEAIPRYLIAGLITSIIVTLYVYSQFGVVSRASAPFDKVGGEPASLGGYYLVVFAVLFSIVLHSESLITILLCSGVIILTLPPFVKTLSRASYLAFGPIMLTLFVLTKRRRMVFGMFMIAGALLFPIAFNDLYTNMTARVMATFTSRSPGQLEDVSIGSGGAKITDLSALARMDSWKTVIQKHFPRNLKTILIGNGVTGIGFVEGQFFLILGETGILGALFFYWILMKTAFFSYRLYRKINVTLIRSISLATIACIIGLLFQSLTTNTFIIVRIMEPFWFLIALVMTVPDVYGVEEALALPASA